MRPVLSALVLAGCTASASQVAPPEYNLYFPTGMALSPDERYLFVVSADADLRYSAGVVHTIDLDQVDAIADPWRDDPNAPPPAGCAMLPARPTVLGCPTTNADGSPAAMMVPGGAVQIGTFGVGIAVQHLTEPDPSSPIVRLFVAVRGDPSISWMDFDESTQTLSCGGGPSFTGCDDVHRLERLHNDAALPYLSPEPFQVAVDPVNQHLFITHLTAGLLTLGSAPAAVGSAPVLENTMSNLFSLTIAGLGTVGVAARPGEPSGLIYVTSRAEDRISVVHAVAGTPPDENLAFTTSFYYDGLRRGGLLNDSRSLIFAPDGSRAYAIGRSPPALQTFDTTLDETGAPRHTALGLVELCTQPANLALADFGQGPRVAVPCFANGQVWIIDPERSLLVATEDVGRGPNGVAASAKHHKIYVGNYADDTLMVVDEKPGLPSTNRAVLRLGAVRPVGQD
jgi:hypothetical protein